MTENTWRARHTEALLNPRAGNERALVRMLEGIEEYVLANRWPDSVLGDGVDQVTEGVRTLLNGTVGRLDQATFDQALSRIRQRADLD